MEKKNNKIKKIFINLKCPIIFLKVNLPERDICAISLPVTLYSPIDNGNKMYCSIKFSRGISFVNRNKIKIITTDNDPAKKK